MANFSDFKLISPILSALKTKGYVKPTPIQEQAIPHLLKGRDLLGIAQTGTGKTAAFSLPLIDRLVKSKVRPKKGRAKALIITPTRELASQINESITSYSKGLNLKTTVIFGGVGYRPQVMSISRGLDILVATPGRLLDLMNQGQVVFDQLEVLILDEADRMLDMGFIKDIKKVIKVLPEKKQTLLFSATMPKDIATLATTLLKNPIKVEVTPQATTVEKIEQRVNLVAKQNKQLLLKSILKDNRVKRALIFTRTKHGANRVVKQLDRVSITSAAIHGNKSQAARERALNGFKTGKIRILVATDIAARGIDVPNISHVINYEIPNDPESYVHRIGRTARAGEGGIAINFCDESEIKLLNGIEKLIKQKIKIDKTHPFHGVEAQTQDRPKSKAPYRRGFKK